MLQPPHLLPALACQILTPDLLPGVDVQVLQTGCVLKLPHSGVDPILFKGHRVPHEPHGGQLRLQALQPPGRGREGG